MPPQHQSRRLTPVERARAHGMAQMGAKTRAIASEFGVHQSTIVRAIEKADRNYESIPHS